MPKQTAEKQIQSVGTQLGINSGRKSFFTLEETDALAHMLLEFHATGMVLESKQVRKVATSYLKLASQGDLVTAKDGLLGRYWFYKFIVDHPFLSDQLSSNPVEISRVKSCTVPCIAHTYNFYEQLESKLGLREKPERKANYDQTDMSFVKATRTKSRRKRFVGPKHTSISQESVPTNNIIPTSTTQISYSGWVLENGYWGAEQGIYTGAR